MFNKINMCYNFKTLLFNIYFLPIVLNYNMNSEEEGKKSITEKSNKVLPVPTNDVQNQDNTPIWNNGIVPYYIDTETYDSTLASRLLVAMKMIEGSSCIVFKRLLYVPTYYNGSWLHFTNPTLERDCVHEPSVGERGEIVTVLGFDCMKQKDILHAVLHALGFKDEVTHPQRDFYIKIIWENLQPKYRSLFRIQSHKQLVEYDPMSVMHFHDRAFSTNGGPTIVPLIPGLQISPSHSLTVLDIMKLRLYFGHECKKRKVDNLLDTCKEILNQSFKGNTGNNDGETDYEYSDSDGKIKTLAEDKQCGLKKDVHTDQKNEENAEIEQDEVNENTVQNKTI